MTIESTLAKLHTYGDLPSLFLSSSRPEDDFRVALLKGVGAACLHGKASIRSGMTSDTYWNEILIPWLLNHRPTNSSAYSTPLEESLFLTLYSKYSKSREVFKRAGEHRKVMSYSSYESLHLGGNWAANFIHVLNLPDSEYMIIPDIQCSDVWFFRGSPPANFGGVAVLVDAERNVHQQGYQWFSHYPLALYVGPQPPPFDGEKIPSDSTSAPAMPSVWMPFASSSFAQRLRYQAKDLLDRSRFQFETKRRKFLGYLARNCVPHREIVFQVLCRLAALKNWQGCDPLGICGTKSFQSNIYIDRYSDDYLDTSVDLFQSYKFSLVFENTDSPGYVTEKIISALLAGSIPIFFGNSKVLDFVNEDSFIFVKQSDIDQLFVEKEKSLGIFSNSVDLDDWLSRHTWINRIYDLMASEIKWKEMQMIDVITNFQVFDWGNSGIVKEIKNLLVKKDGKFSDDFQLATDPLSFIALSEWPVDS